MGPPIEPLRPAVPAPAALAEGSLRARTARALVWASAPHLARAGVTLAVYAAVGRLVAPADAGLAQAAFAILAVATQLVGLGTDAAVVRHPRVSQPFLSTVLLVNLVTGGLLAAGLFLGAPALAALLGMDGRLTEILRWMAASLVLLAITVVPSGLLIRRLAFRRATVVTMAAAGAGAAAGILAAALGLGVLAFPVGVACYAALAAIAFWFSAGWRPSLGCDTRELPGLLKFSLAALGAKLLRNVGPHVQTLLVGRLLGPAALGVYALAENMVREPVRNVMRASDSVLFPALSAIQADHARCRRFYLSALRLELALLGPLVAFIAVFAPELVTSLYGSGWQRATLLVQCLAIVTLRTITAHTVGAVFLSQGRADVQLRWTAYGQVFTVAYVVLGVRWGIEGVALAVAIGGFAGWATTHTMANRLIDLRFADFVRGLASPAACIVLFAVSLAAVKTALTAAAGSWTLAGVVWFVPVAALGYLAIVSAIDIELLRTVRVVAREAFSSRTSEVLFHSVEAAPRLEPLPISETDGVLR